MLCDSSFPGAEQGTNVPRKAWMKGVSKDLLVFRGVFFQIIFEEECRHAEVAVCEMCDQFGIARMNPKKMDGKETTMPTSDFVVIMEVLRRGPLAPELQINEKRLQIKGGAVGLAKCGNSSSAPYLIEQDTRLRKMVDLAPLSAYIPYLNLLKSHSATHDAGILQQFLYSRLQCTCSKLILLDSSIRARLAGRAYRGGQQKQRQRQGSRRLRCTNQPIWRGER